MKKFIFTISAILLFSIAIFAQTDPVKPTEWILLLPENEEFSVSVPDNINLSAFGKDKEYRQYKVTVDGAYFFIFSDDLKDDFQYKNTLKFIEANQRTELEKQQSSAAMKFRFSDDENFFHTIYTVKTNKRAYIFHMVSEKQDDPNVERFFNSLKVNEKPAAIEFEKVNAYTKSNIEVRKPVDIEVQKPAEDKNPAQSITTPANGRGQGTGLGSGSGNGIGTGSGFGNGTNDGSQKNQNQIPETKPLNIISKPRPKYTDFARFYEITGNIRTRVTFRSDGTIGSVTPVTKLPFGLTNSAVDAAKQMRFEPYSVKGKPMSITKVVVFNFTIY